MCPRCCGRDGSGGQSDRSVGTVATPGADGLGRRARMLALSNGSRTRMLAALLDSLCGCFRIESFAPILDD